MAGVMLKESIALKKNEPKFAVYERILWSKVFVMLLFSYKAITWIKDIISLYSKRK